jgi:hypothetical protein
MLGRRGSDLADHGGQRAAALRVVPVSGRQVALEDDLGAIAGRLLLEARRSTSSMSSSFEAKCA